MPTGQFAGHNGHSLEFRGKGELADNSDFVWNDNLTTEQMDVFKRQVC